MEVEIEDLHVQMEDISKAKQAVRQPFPFLSSLGVEHKGWRYAVEMPQYMMIDGYRIDGVGQYGPISLSPDITPRETILIFTFVFQNEYHSGLG